MTYFAQLYLASAMSQNKEKSSSARAANQGSWILKYNPDRSVRMGDMREFKDDCVATHESEVGSEAGPVLQLGHATYKAIPVAPPIPLESDFTGSDHERAYAQAMSEYQGAQTVWIQACKSAQHHKDSCESGVLPKTFVWILSRLDKELRSRIEQEAQFSVLNLAIPRDPAALMTLVESVMAKGDMDDEGYDDFVLIRDLFSASLAMKDAQSLTDGARIFKDKMAVVQSKPAYYCVYTDADGKEQTKQAFSEEFFVHLMFENMSKKYEEAKIVYANSVSSEAIKRITTFDGLTKHFSSVRNVTTGDTVSASALTTVSKKAKKDKGKPKSRSVDKSKTPTAWKADRVFIPGTHRSCRHCKGAHFDDLCPDQKKKVKSNSSDDPSQEEIAKVLAHLSAKKAAKQAKEAKALAAQQQKKYTDEDIAYALEEYASSSRE